MLGSLALLSLSTAACVYSIVQLGALSGRARAALDNDHRMIQFQEALTDAFLSEVRYSGKYIISRKEDRYEQLRQFKNDFARHTGELRLRSRSEKVTAYLSKIEEIHGHYHRLFDQEVAYIRAKQNYAQSRYEQEREKLVESGLNELERLKAELRSGLQGKLEQIDRSARTARTITIATTVLVVLLGFVLWGKISAGLATAGKAQSSPAASVAQVFHRAMTGIRSQAVRLAGGYKALGKKLTRQLSGKGVAT
jgi:CHASE3 domain sensor protein